MFISLLAAMLVASALADTKVWYDLTPQKVNTKFLNDVQQNGAKSVVTFVGFSGAGYQNETAMLEVVGSVLADMNPNTTIVNAGATAPGIGALYGYAHIQGFTTTGIVSMQAVNKTNPNSTQWAPGVDMVFCVKDDTWGGFDANGNLEPTSEAMVMVSDYIVGIGGGDVAYAELKQGQANGVEVRFYPADKDHQTAINKAKAAGQPAPTDFRGAAEKQLHMCDSPPHALLDRCLYCGGQGRTCSPNFMRNAELPSVAFRSAKGPFAVNSTVKVAVFSMEDTIIMTQGSQHDPDAKWTFVTGMQQKIQQLAKDHLIVVIANNPHASEEWVVQSTTSAAPTTPGTTVTPTAPPTGSGASGTTLPATTEGTTTADTGTYTPGTTVPPGPTTIGTQGTTVDCGMDAPCVGTSCPSGGVCVDGCCSCPNGYLGCSCGTNPTTTKQDYCYQGQGVCAGGKCSNTSGSTAAATTPTYPATASHAGCLNCPCSAGACDTGLVCINQVCVAQGTATAAPPACVPGYSGCQCIQDPLTLQFGCAIGSLQCLHGLCQAVGSTTTITASTCTAGTTNCNCAALGVCLTPTDSCKNSICVPNQQPGPTTSNRKRDVADGVGDSMPPPMHHHNHHHHHGWKPLPKGQFNDTFVSMLESKYDNIASQLNVSLFAAISLAPDMFAKPSPNLWTFVKPLFDYRNPLTQYKINMTASFFVGAEAGRANDLSCVDRQFAEAAHLQFMTPAQFLTGAAPQKYDCAVVTTGHIMPPTDASADTSGANTITGQGSMSVMPESPSNEPEDHTLRYVIGGSIGFLVGLCILGGIWFFVQKRSAAKNRYTLLLSEEGDDGF